MEEHRTAQMTERDILVRLDTSMSHLADSITALLESQKHLVTQQSSEVSSLRRDFSAKLDNLDRSVTQQTVTTETLLSTISGFVGKMDELLAQERKERQDQMADQKSLIERVLQHSGDREERSAERAHQLSDREVEAARRREDEANRQLREAASVLWEGFGKYLLWAAGLVGVGGAAAYGFLQMAGG